MSGNGDQPTESIPLMENSIGALLAGASQSQQPAAPSSYQDDASSLLLVSSAAMNADGLAGGPAAGFGDTDAVEDLLAALAAEEGDGGDFINEDHLPLARSTVAVQSGIMLDTGVAADEGAASDEDDDDAAAVDADGDGAGPAAAGGDYDDDDNDMGYDGDNYDDLEPAPEEDEADHLRQDAAAAARGAAYNPGASSAPLLPSTNDFPGLGEDGVFAAGAATSRPKSRHHRYHEEEWDPAFPDSVLKRLVNVAGPMQPLSRDALRAVNCAVELILGDLAAECMKVVHRRGGKSITYDVVADICGRVDRFAFLSDVIPPAGEGRVVSSSQRKVK